MRSPVVKCHTAIHKVTKMSCTVTVFGQSPSRTCRSSEYLLQILRSPATDMMDEPVNLSLPEAEISFLKF